MTENARRIEILSGEESRRIAAGEVIERPAALVREFLDNAIDAGSKNIDISIEEGGCKKVEIADDGSGMSREDLDLCYMTHATSKIRCLDDLDSVRTLGFRGEALSAAAAVSRLEIITSTDGREAWFLQIGPGESFLPKFEQTRRNKGSTVRAVNLFESIPARKRFLKREGSEGTLCRQAFIDKALAFYKINFRFTQDGKLKDFFPAVSSPKARFAACILKAGEDAFLHEINVNGNGFSACIVIGGPELYRNDRRQLYVFANGRRINDYSLLQAMEYGAQGWFPNGTHPVGAVFVEIDPALADFNIHPAKREARFRDSGAIHQAVSGGVKNFFHSYFLRKSKEEEKEENHRGHGVHGGSFTTEFGQTKFDLEDHTVQNLSEHRDYSYKNSVPLRELCVGSSSDNSARFIGRLFGLFILIESNDKLYIIDQHAAHERILYDKFLSKPIPKQELLAPIPFCTESDDDDLFLETKKDELSVLGIDIEKDEGGWRIDALPSSWRSGDKATVKEILNLRNAGENMAKKWAATLCCHEAIKDGDYPGDETAFALALEALELPDPHCPHGRPIWTEIGKDALFKAVRRS